MKLNRALSIALTASMALSMIGCSSTSTENTSETSSTSTTNTTSTAVYEASLSSPLPSSNTFYPDVVAFAETVEERTNGQLKISIFFDSLLGSETDVIQQVAAGEIEMTLAGHGAVSLYAPEYGFIMAPFMARDLDHMRAIFDSEIYDEFQTKLIEEQNLNLIAPYCRGVRHMFSNRVIESVDDLKGMTIRVPNDNLYLAGWNAQGVNTQPLDVNEIYTSLDTGVIEACEGPYDQLTMLNTFEVLDYVYSTGQNIETGAFYASQEWLDSLPDDVEAIFLEEVETLMAYMDEMSPASTDAALEQVLAEGMELREFDAEPMFEAAGVVWDEMFATTWTAATREEIEALAN